MSNPLRTLRREGLAAVARARGALPGWINDAVFALPTSATDDTRALCARHGWRSIDLGPNPPASPELLNGSSDEATLAGLRASCSPHAAADRAFAAVLPRGRVLGIACTAIAPGGVVLADVSPHAGEPLRRHRALASFAIAARPRRLAGRCALIGAIGHNNFYHWMLDVLPRIALLREAGLAGIDRWIVAESRLPAAAELLARCGLDGAELVPLGRFGHVECEELAVTSAPGRICVPTPRGAAALRALLGGGVAGTRRVYIARRGRRKVANEAELLPVLREAGFETISMEGRSLAEQFESIRGASLVVAPHGAALAHLVQAAPGATLIELMPPGYGNPAFYALAGACGLRYAVLVGSAAGGGGGVTDRDFAIDAQQLGRAIRAAELSS